MACLAGSLPGGHSRQLEETTAPQAHMQRKVRQRAPACIWSEMCISPKNGRCHQQGTSPRTTSLPNFLAQEASHCACFPSACGATAARPMTLQPAQPGQHNSTGTGFTVASPCRVTGTSVTDLTSVQREALVSTIHPATLLLQPKDTVEQQGKQHMNLQDCPEARHAHVALSQIHLPPKEAFLTLAAGTRLPWHTGRCDGHRLGVPWLCQHSTHCAGVSITFLAHKVTEKSPCKAFPFAFALPMCYITRLKVPDEGCACCCWHV